MFKRIAFAFSAALLAVGFSGAAQASLIGTSVDITSPHGDCLGVTVGGGVECRIQDTPTELDDVIDIDIQDSRVVFDILDVGQSGGGFLWTDSPFVFDVVVSGLTWVNDPSAAIASISVTTELFGTPGTVGAPNTVGAMQTGANEVSLNFADVNRTVCGSALCARVTVDITPEHSDLPEPATIALFGLGLAGLGLAARRRRDTSNM